MNQTFCVILSTAKDDSVELERLCVAACFPHPLRTPIDAVGAIHESPVSRN